MLRRRELLRTVALGAGALLANDYRWVGLGKVHAAGDVLNVGQYVAPDTLDPDVESADHILGLLRNVHEPLVDLDAGSMRLVGVLATKWSVSSDAKEYRFDLRRDVRFADGTPFNASAAKSSVERVLTLKKGPYWVAKNIASIDSPTDYTLVIRLSNAFPLLGASGSVPSAAR